MTRLIVDASTVGNVMLPDEHGKLTSILAEHLAGNVLIEPAHWPIETCGLVLKAASRGRLPVDERDFALNATLELIASAEVESASRAQAIVELAIKSQLTIYDAAYLELALRTKTPLLTSDKALRAAATKANAELVPIE